MAIIMVTASAAIATVVVFWALLTCRAAATAARTASVAARSAVSAACKAFDVLRSTAAALFFARSHASTSGPFSPS